MTRGDLKTGRTGSRTLFQILADYYQTGATRDRDFWQEYGRVVRNLAAVRWSRGLRVAILGPPVEPVLADEDLAAEDVNGQLAAVIPFPVWSHIRLAGLDHVVLVAAEHSGAVELDLLIGHVSWRR
jgi:hypothetical protein